MTQTVTISAAIKRKAAQLPRYVIIDAGALADWPLHGTTAVEVTINQATAVRRNLKPWGKGSRQWFIDLPEALCRSTGVDTGDTVRLDLCPAADGLPDELQTLIDGNAAAAAAWRQKTAARQRQLGDYVRAAKRPETRARRARAALLPAAP